MILCVNHATMTANTPQLVHRRAIFVHLDAMVLTRKNLVIHAALEHGERLKDRSLNKTHVRKCASLGPTTLPLERRLKMRV